MDQKSRCDLNKRRNKFSYSNDQNVHLSLIKLAKLIILLIKKIKTLVIDSTKMQKKDESNLMNDEKLVVTKTQRNES